MTESQKMRQKVLLF